MEALRRDTLKWEKIKLNGKSSNDYLKYEDGTTIDYFSTLAVKGKINTKNLGYCSHCRKIMTAKQYEKHIKKYAKASQCINCYYCKKREKRPVKSNGVYYEKAQLHCGLNNDEPIVAKQICNKVTCRGSFVTDIPYLSPKIPSKIITIKELLNNRWKITYMDAGKMEMRYKSDNLYCKIDENGLLIHFRYKNTLCYWDGNCLRSRYSIVSDSKKIKKIIGRLYE